MRHLQKRHRILWLLSAGIIAIGLPACLLSGRTLAHALCIALCATYLSGMLHLTDSFVPNGQSSRIRKLSGGIFIAAGAVLILLYAWHFSAEQTIFINDDALYHFQQLELSAALHQGLHATLLHFIRSLSTDYTCLANLLLAPAFSLTDGTADGFGLAVTLMTWPLLLWQLRRLTLRLADQLRLTGRQTLLLCAGACVSVVALPILHRAALWRQVNLLGLPLLMQVIFLTLGLDADRREPLRWTALLISCVLLALMRRWFLFFLAGWLPLWGAWTLVGLIRQKHWPSLRRFCVCCLLCLLLGTLLLWPVLSRAIQGDYAVAYAYWRKDSGGLVYEIRNQGWLLGVLSGVLMTASYLWGLMQRRSSSVRVLSALLPCCGVIGLLLFTRIQNMTYHQVTFLMPVYVTGHLLLFAMLASLTRRALRNSLALSISAAMLLQGALCLRLEKPQELSPLLPHVSLRPPVRADLPAIVEVSEFIAGHCTPSSPALILMNSGEYDRLTFVTHAYPDLSLRSLVALDRIALPSDGFPRMYFSASCILVPTVPQTNQPGGTVEKLTHYLLADEADRFEVIRSFPMEGFDLLALRRRGPVEYAEYEELLQLFAQEHAQYPAVYGDRMGFFYGLTLE